MCRPVAQKGQRRNEGEADNIRTFHKILSMFLVLPIIRNPADRSPSHPRTFADTAWKNICCQVCRFLQTVLFLGEDRRKHAGGFHAPYKPVCATCVFAVTGI